MSVSRPLIVHTVYSAKDLCDWKCLADYVCMYGVYVPELPLSLPLSVYISSLFQPVVRTSIWIGSEL